MRLSKIKLAGFKSFVDPTTFTLPSNLVGIVGPNGCGKSNVIDAVRWVMGEMSAKHLRGDSMADVIFNGSASRKPVGTASIELFFDNSDGSIGGQYAQYAEICLKRAISRDGTSSYFLNNTRCRRKDITELFLGTGLGSRSYAIIEQGMVSRLIDAKPEEMRAYIEEAAGISKYKERRRETETRIQHARDNLARLSDLRDEIAKQLDYLQKQARSAERYKEYKASERRLEAELLAMRITEINASIEGGALELARRQTEMDAALADLRRIEADIVAARERQIAVTELFNQVQARHYAVQSDISRLEQAMAHARELRDRQREDLNQAAVQLGSLQAETSRDQASLDELDSILRSFEPQVLSARAAESDATHALTRAEESLEAWQADWQEYNIGLKELQQTVHVARARAEHLEAQVAQIRRQQETLEIERSSISLADLDERLASQVAAEKNTEARATALQAQLDALAEESQQLRGLELQFGGELEALTADLASRRGQVSALQAVQDAALGGEDQALVGWLGRTKLAGRPRLAQRLRVDKDWVLAVETVLGDFLQAVMVPPGEWHLDDLPDTPVSLLEEGGQASASPRHDSILSFVADPGPAAGLLSDVLVARDLAEAVRIRGRLQPHESVITPDAIWLGPAWVRVNRGQRSASGILAREDRLRELRDVISRDEVLISELEDRRRAARERLAVVAQTRDQATAEFNASNRDHAEAMAVLDNLQGEIGRARDRKQSLDDQLQHVAAELAELLSNLAECRNLAESSEAELERMGERKTGFHERQALLLDQYNCARAAAEHCRSNVARLDVEIEGRRVARESMASSILRLNVQSQQLAVRIRQLEADVESAEPAIGALQDNLSVQLAEQLVVARSLAERRQDLEDVDSVLRENETGRSIAEKAVAAGREAVDELRMRVRESEIRRESLMEAFVANGADLATVLQEMPADAEAVRWQSSLDDTRRKIDRLGPINLAAIEQFNEQSERKKYLDAQNDDLMAALDTLEQAIRKIDRETRARFQETFENVNQGLKRIFPRLFGGGHAYLSLEGDDILSAGVMIMARPPGKRNSHIHLLSGGEKALTAVSLIFSIFELNPAPFCLLDEVDAPLDEANVGRFCDIVREMSQRVQFVVITHNKTTMEMVNQLTGVTMNEPGVSRLVSVDLDAAVQLAAS